MNKRQQLLQRVGDFIRRILPTLAVNDETVTTQWSGFWLSRPAEGTLHLTGAESDDYRKLLRDLWDEFAKEEDLSINSVSQILGDTLFEALDISSQRGTDFDARLTSSLQTLRQRLSTGASTYTCFVPVDGLELDVRPLLLGHVRFVRFGQSHLRELMRPTKGRVTNAKRRTKWTLS
jgi:hypothetical protein